MTLTYLRPLLAHMIVLLAAFAASAAAPLCRYEPADARQDETITIWFNAAAGNRALQGYTGTVYMTTGLITADNDRLDNGLLYTVGPDATTVPEKYTMKRSASDPDLYSISLTPQTFYGIDSSTDIRMLGFTFATPDGSRVAADADGGTIFVPFRANTGTMWYRPLNGTLADRLTFYFDATAGNGALAGFDGDVYIHTGVITDASSGGGDWKHTTDWPENNSRTLMHRTSANSDIYTVDITPADFYRLDGSELVKSFAFVTRNADCSVLGKEEGEKDIFVPYARSEKPGGASLGRFVGAKVEGDRVYVTGEDGILELQAYSPYIVKVLTYADNAGRRQRPSIALAATPQGSFSAAGDDKDFASFTTGSVGIRVAKADCRVTFTDSLWNPILSERTSLDNVSPCRSVNFEGAGDRAFYGGGYNGKYTDISDRKIVVNNTQTGGWDNTWNAPHNICIPFIVSTSGYGLFFDDSYRNATVTPSPRGTTYSSASPAAVAYYFIGSSNGSMGKVLENYTWLTGRQPLPPYWALGYITSRYGYRSTAEATDVINRIKAAGLPLDGIVFDLYWQGEGNNGMGNLDWYRAKFPDPAGMMADFNAKGVKTVLITEPFFTSETVNYQPLKAKGYFADDHVDNMEWLGSQHVGLLDATNPDALDWMWEFYKARTAEGVAGWWLDLGEPERHDEDSHHLGGTVAEVHNEFGNLWVERVYRGLREDFPDIRPFIMPRAGSAGMQRLGTFPWTGDIRRSWAGLQAQVPALLNSGMSGVAWMGSDVGGFANNNDTDAELYLRWVQFAVFSPMLRTHSTYLPEPYHACYSGIIDDLRRFINLRYRWLPYTYTLAWENATIGSPLARPLNYHDTPGAAPSPGACTDQYLWGRDIMVAPVLTSATSRTITFPQGRWVDLNDLTATYEGGTTVTYRAPLGTLPHFGRKGSFLPQFTRTTFANTSDADASELTVTYLLDPESTTSAKGYLFDDDHVSPMAFNNGQVSATAFTGAPYTEGHAITIRHSGRYDGMAAERTYTFVIPGYRLTGDIYLNDNTSRLPQLPTTDALASYASDAYAVDADGTLRIKVSVDATKSATLYLNVSASGIDNVDAAADALSLAFNGATGHISYASPADGTITVSDLAGTVRAQFPAREGTHTEALPQLNTGIYLCTLRAAGLARSVKIIVR